MSFELFNIIKDFANKLSKETKINEEDKGCTLFAKFTSDKYKMLTIVIWKLLMKKMEMGEVVNLTISSGEFRDMGIKTISIYGGEIWEFYDYESFSHYYIRLIKMRKDEEEWVSLYVDYVPKSAWWTKKERGE